MNPGLPNLPRVQLTQRLKLKCDDCFQTLLSIIFKLRPSTSDLYLSTASISQLKGYLLGGFKTGFKAGVKNDTSRFKELWKPMQLGQHGVVSKVQDLKARELHGGAAQDEMNTA